MHERPAIFLDRDGTINEDVGYAAHPDEIQVYPYAAQAIRQINEAGLKVIVVTNQSGIARGYLDEFMLARIHDHLINTLARDGARIDAVYYCPHHPRIGNDTYRKTCDCRKPQPGMLEQAARDHDIDLSTSYVIGDKTSDINLAENAGAYGVLVKTGYGEITLRNVTGTGEEEETKQVLMLDDSARHSSLVTRHSCRPHFVAENLLAAVTRILTEIDAHSRD